MGILSPSQRLAIIILLFKKGDKTDISNYRPISLTNCDYKILAYIFSLCLEPYLTGIIHRNQTTYMKEWFIGTNICSVQDILNWKNAGKRPVVLFLDFRKAFDSVSHIFIMALLLHMQFPPVYVTWLFVLYNQAISVVHHKNWLSNTLTLLQGVRQGCPLSCHLFNFIGQVLIYSLYDYGYFKWWMFCGDPCSLYADDIALFCLT